MIDLSPFAGRWNKTNEGPQWVHRVETRIDGDALYVRLFGDEDWGEVRAESVYALNAETDRGGAFLARYALRDAEVEVEGNVNLGLLVLATWVRWREGIAKSNAFTREFFYLVSECGSKATALEAR